MFVKLTGVPTLKEIQEKGKPVAGEPGVYELRGHKYYSAAFTKVA